MVSVNKGDWNRLTSVDQIHEFNIQGKLSVHVAGASSPIKCRLASLIMCAAGETAQRG